MLKTCTALKCVMPSSLGHECALGVSKGLQGTPYTEKCKLPKSF